MNYFQSLDFAIEASRKVQGGLKAELARLEKDFRDGVYGKQGYEKTRADILAKMDSNTQSALAAVNEAHAKVQGRIDALFELRPDDVCIQGSTLVNAIDDKNELRKLHGAYTHNAAMRRIVEARAKQVGVDMVFQYDHGALTESLGNVTGLASKFVRDPLGVEAMSVEGKTFAQLMPQAVASMSIVTD